MSTLRSPMRGRSWQRWSVTALALGMGVVFLVAGWIGVGLGLGLAMFTIMAVFAGGVELAARRSETVKGLLDHKDERISSIDLAATAIAGLALITVIIVAVVVEILRGESGAPYTWLGAIAGVSYIIALVALRLRG